MKTFWIWWDAIAFTGGVAQAINVAFAIWWAILHGQDGVIMDFNRFHEQIPELVMFTIVAIMGLVTLWRKYIHRGW